MDGFSHFIGLQQRDGESRRLGKLRELNEFLGQSRLDPKILDSLAFQAIDRDQPEFYQLIIQHGGHAPSRVGDQSIEEFVKQKSGKLKDLVHSDVHTPNASGPGASVWHRERLQTVLKGIRNKTPGVIESLDGLLFHPGAPVTQLEIHELVVAAIKSDNVHVIRLLQEYAEDCPGISVFPQSVGKLIYGKKGEVVTLLHELMKKESIARQDRYLERLVHEQASLAHTIDNFWTSGAGKKGMFGLAVTGISAVGLDYLAGSPASASELSKSVDMSKVHRPGSEADEPRSQEAAKLN